MDPLADSLQAAFESLVSATCDLLDAKDASQGKRTRKSDAALEAFYGRLQLFHTRCDHVQQFLDSLKQKVLSEAVYDDTRKVSAGSSSAFGMAEVSVAIPEHKPPTAITASRVEAVSKVLRLIAQDVQQAGAAGNRAATTSSQQAGMAVGQPATSAGGENPPSGPPEAAF